MRYFRIPCHWQMTGVYEIQAESLEEAIIIAEEEFLPKNDSYIEDSFEIEHEDIQEVDDETND